MKKWIALIFLMVPALAVADSTITIRDWAWIKEPVENSFLYAVTVNENQTAIGQYCYISEGECYYLLNANITCNQEEEFTALVNSDIGSYSINAICGHQFEESNVLYLYPFEDIDRLIKESNDLGIAIAMKSGHFKVVRFSLAGSTQAIRDMRAEADRLHVETKETKPLRYEEYL